MTSPLLLRLLIILDWRKDTGFSLWQAIENLDVGKFTLNETKKTLKTGDHV